MGAGCAALLELAPASTEGAAETAKDSVVSSPLLDFDGSCSSGCVGRLPRLSLGLDLTSGLAGFGSLV